MTGAEIALVSGITTALGGAIVGILKIIEKVTSPGKKPSLPPPDMCVPCRENVTGLTFTLDSFIKAQEGYQSRQEKQADRQFEVLEQIRDNTRPQPATGRFPAIGR